jgi:hypothetical protein
MVLRLEIREISPWPGQAPLAKIIGAPRLIARQSLEDFKPLTPPWCLITDACSSVEAFKRTVIRYRRKP